MIIKTSTTSPRFQSKDMPSLNGPITLYASIKIAETISRKVSTPRCTMASPEQMEPRQNDAETTESSSTKRNITT